MRVSFFLLLFSSSPPPVLLLSLPLYEQREQRVQKRKEKNTERLKRPYRKVDDRVENGRKQQLERETRDRFRHEKRRDLVQATTRFPPQQCLLRIHDSASIGRGLEDRTQNHKPERGDAVEDSGRGVGVGCVGGAEAEVGSSQKDAEEEVLGQLDACKEKRDWEVGRRLEERESIKRREKDMYRVRR